MYARSMTTSENTSIWHAKSAIVTLAPLSGLSSVEKSVCLSRIDSNTEERNRGGAYGLSVLQSASWGESGMVSSSLSRVMNGMVRFLPQGLPSSGCCLFFDACFFGVAGFCSARVCSSWLGSGQASSVNWR